MGITRMPGDTEQIPNVVLAAVGNHQTELPEGCGKRADAGQLP